MKPYYEHGGLTIYHGDCREVLPTLLGPVAVVTDQPYGTGWSRAYEGAMFTFKKITAESAAWDVWDVSWLNLIPDARAIAAFAPNSKLDDLRAAMPEPSSCIWWRKTNALPTRPQREPVIVWPSTLQSEPEFAAYNGDRFDRPLHPTQKPLELMLWVLGFVDDALTVLDPFMGSGTTLRAAKDLGRDGIGIEINEQYCETAAERLGQEVLDLGGAA